MKHHLYRKEGRERFWGTAIYDRIIGLFRLFKNWFYRNWGRLLDKFFLDPMCTLYLNMYEYVFTLKIENMRSILES